MQHHDKPKLLYRPSAALITKVNNITPQSKSDEDLLPGTYCQGPSAEDLMPKTFCQEPPAEDPTANNSPFQPQPTSLMPNLMPNLYLRYLPHAGCH